jgi:hypothetical protein
MIKHLSEQIILDRIGNGYTASAPDNWDLMDKINELIDEVNKLKTKLEKENNETDE